MFIEAHVVLEEFIKEIASVLEARFCLLSHIERGAALSGSEAGSGGAGVGAGAVGDGSAAGATLAVAGGGQPEEDFDEAFLEAVRTGQFEPVDPPPVPPVKSSRMGK
jgi:hypothetical protein